MRLPLLSSKLTSIYAHVRTISDSIHWHTHFANFSQTTIQDTTKQMNLHTEQGAHPECRRQMPCSYTTWHVWAPSRLATRSSKTNIHIFMYIYIYVYKERDAHMYTYITYTNTSQKPANPLNTCTSFLILKNIDFQYFPANYHLGWQDAWHRMETFPGWLPQPTAVFQAWFSPRMAESDQSTSPCLSRRASLPGSFPTSRAL